MDKNNNGELIIQCTTPDDYKHVFRIFNYEPTSSHHAGLIGLNNTNRWLEHGANTCLRISDGYIVNFSPRHTYEKMGKRVITMAEYLAGTKQVGTYDAALNKIITGELKYEPKK